MTEVMPDHTHRPTDEVAELLLDAIWMKALHEIQHEKLMKDLEAVNQMLELFGERNPLTQATLVALQTKWGDAANYDPIIDEVVRLSNLIGGLRDEYITARRCEASA